MGLVGPADAHERGSDHPDVKNGVGGHHDQPHVVHGARASEDQGQADAPAREMEEVWVDFTGAVCRS